MLSLAVRHVVYHIQPTKYVMKLSMRGPRTCSERPFHRSFATNELNWFPQPQLDVEEAKIPVSPLAAPSGLLSELDRELKQKQLNHRAILDLFSQALGHKMNIEPHKIKQIISIILRSPLLDSLHTLLDSHALYTRQVYIHELHLCSARSLPKLALRLHEQWHEKHGNFHSASEMRLMLQCFLHGDPMQATKLFRQFLAIGARPTLGTQGYNDILRIWVHSGHSTLSNDQLVQIYEDMMNHTSTNPPNQDTYALLIRGMSKIEKSKIYFEKALEVGFNTSLIHFTYLRRLSEALQFSLALEHYKALKQGTNRHLITDTILASLLEDCAAHGDYQTASELFRDAESVGITPTTRMYSSLIDLCAKIQNSEAALNILVYDLPHHGIEPDEHIYNALAKLYSSTQELDKARSIFDEMKIRKFPVLPSTFDALISAHLMNSDQQNLNAAFAYWTELRQARLQPPPRLLASLLLHLPISESWFNTILTSYVPFLRSDTKKLIKALANDQTASLDRILHVFYLILRQATAEENYFITLVARAAQDERWDAAFDLGNRAAELALKSLHEELDEEIQVKWEQKPQSERRSATTSTQTDEITKRRRKPFSLTPFFYSHFVAQVVQPNGLTLPNDIDSSKFAQKYWDQDSVERWQKQLAKWRAELRH